MSKTIITEKRNPKMNKPRRSWKRSNIYKVKSAANPLLRVRDVVERQPEIALSVKQYLYYAAKKTISKLMNFKIIFKFYSYINMYFQYF